MNAPFWLVAGVGAAVIRALGVSWRIEWDGLEHVDEARRVSPNVIYAFWHGRLLPLSWTHRHRAIQVLASEHRDGEMLGRTIRRLGFGHVRGSSTRGGARAIRELARLVRAGNDLGITVDGPRGPRYRVKPGPLQIARMTGAAIVPISTASASHRTLESWDAFEIPHPFTRVLITHGQPVVVSHDADSGEIETARTALEDQLNRITGEADRRVGD